MVVLHLNNLASFRRVLKRFELSPDDNIHITKTSKAFLFTELPIPTVDLLMTRVELGTPISQKQLEVLAHATPERSREPLLKLPDGETYRKHVLPKRYNILDLLDDNPDWQLPIAEYIESLKPLTPRQYSISSSLIANIEFMSSAQGATHN